jgi:uncharacterized caspase-like protein
VPTLEPDRHVRGRHTEGIGDQLEGSAVLLDDLAVEASKVEAVEDVVLVDFCKVLVAFGREEPGDPATPSASSPNKSRGEGEGRAEMNESALRMMCTHEFE